MATLNQSSKEQTLIFPYTDELENYSNKIEIGRGTYGVVYKAQHKDTNTCIALKCISRHDEVEGFPLTALREINILQRLTNENIVHIFGICRSPRKDSVRYDFYLILEYCDYDLNKIIDNRRITFSLEHIKCIMYQTLAGLGFLHDKKILHRDIKPANILITKDGIVKLADFGLSKVIKPKENNSELKDTNRYVSLYYRAPELLLGDQNYHTAIDMWSVGCTFAELWTRKPIIQGKGEKHQLALIEVLCGNIEWPGIHHLLNYSDYKSSEKLDLQIKECLTDYRTYIQSSSAIDFINKFLTLDPEKRITVKTAINSSFLQSKPSSNVLKLLLTS